MIQTNQHQENNSFKYFIMQVLVFSSDIESEEKFIDLVPSFNKNLAILKWSIDVEDRDNVIRIEATEDLTEVDVIKLVKMNGFKIEPLPD